VDDKSKSVDSSYLDFETRKSLHINLTRETHASLRMICFRHRLSMQEVIEEAAIQMIEESPYMVKMLLDLSEKKRKKAVKRIAKSDAESIFKVIEDANPFSVNDDKAGD
jgi:hypothetical protein